MSTIYIDHDHTDDRYPGEKIPAVVMSEMDKVVLVWLLPDGMEYREIRTIPPKSTLSYRMSPRK